jgi:hypothetical protein
MVSNLRRRFGATAGIKFLGVKTDFFDTMSVPELSITWAVHSVGAEHQGMGCVMALARKGLISVG